jgi:predicted DNA-binding transcriptional regulator AlpA
MDTLNTNPSEDDQRRVTQPEAARLLGGVSSMTMWRWRHDPEMQFPQALEINGRVYFRRAEIVNWRPPAKAAPSPASRFKKCVTA